MLAEFFLFPRMKKRQKDGDMRISRLFKWLWRRSSQAFQNRHSPAASRTCRNAGNSVLTAEGTTSKGTGSCKVEFCIFYRLTLRTFWTKDVNSCVGRLFGLYFYSIIIIVIIIFINCKWVDTHPVGGSGHFTYYICTNCEGWLL
jgi:hypothetical protein